MDPTSERATHGDGTHVHLHIGTMKSGTSFIQDVIWRNREPLGANGVLIPEQPLPPAVADVRGRNGVRRQSDTSGTWDKVLQEIAAWKGGQVLLSQEHMSASTAEVARRLVETLEPHRVSVLITARDLVRVVPSHWQTTVKNGKEWDLEQFASALSRSAAEDKDKQPFRGFWRHHDLAPMIERWGDIVGIDNVTLVTVPRSGQPPELLWERFCAALDITPHDYDTTPDQRANFTLSLTATEMLRAVNKGLAGRLQPAEHRKYVTGYVANAVLREDSPARAASDKIRLSRATHAWAAEHGRAIAEAVGKTGVRVIGDLDELIAAPAPGEPSDPTLAPRLETPQEAVTTIVALLLRVAKLDGEARMLRAGRGQRGGGRSPGTSGADGPRDQRGLTAEERPGSAAAEMAPDDADEDFEEHFSEPDTVDSRGVANHRGRGANDAGRARRGRRRPDSSAFNDPGD